MQSVEPIAVKYAIDSRGFSLLLQFGPNYAANEFVPLAPNWKNSSNRSDAIDSARVSGGRRSFLGFSLGREQCN